MKKIIFTLLITIMLGSCTIFKPVVSEFNDREISLINSAEPMRIYSIFNPADSLILRTKSVLLKSVNEMTHKLVEKMKIALSKTTGQGLAAPQVGINKRVIIIERKDKPGAPVETYINPVITQYNDKKIPVREACLSISPTEMQINRSRAFKVDIEYYDLHWQKHSETVDGLTAVMFQHETDHLNGVLFTDKLK